MELTYSIVLTIEVPYRYRPTEDRPPGLSWKYLGKESCGTDDGYVAYRWDAVATQEEFDLLLDFCWWQSDGESGGILGPRGAEKHWAPSVVYCASGDMRATVTAWPKNGPCDRHRFECWPEICERLEQAPDARRLALADA